MSTTRSLRRTIVELALVAAGALPVLGLPSPAAATPPQDGLVATPDTDDGPELSVEGYDTEEGTPGDQINLPFIVTATEVPTSDLTFRFHTGAVGFGAVPGEDFEPVDDQFVLPAGETSVILLVPIIPDDVENDHDGLVIAWIADPSTGSIGTGTAVAKILDDDPAGEDGPGGVEPVDPGAPGGQPDEDPGADDELPGDTGTSGGTTPDDLGDADEDPADELALGAGQPSDSGPAGDLSVPVLRAVFVAVVAAIGFVLAHLLRTGRRA